MLSALTLTRIPSPSVVAVFTLESVPISTFFGLVGEEIIQSSVDLVFRCLRGILVADKDPNSWESSVGITLVVDSVGSVVCVNYPSAGRGRHVFQTVVRRRFPVHARAISFTKASGFRAIAFSIGLLWVIDSKAVSISLFIVWSWAHPEHESTLHSALF